jgi:23S rRNA-/tRNA-specific pseudouridylate synthase
MVIAKTLTAHRKLARDFMKKRVEKRYLALIEGSVKDDEGTIELPIGRFAERKIWDIKHDGKSSVTRYRVLERHADATLVELDPVTGRTNQLRIHCASVGHPIVGDTQRGGRSFSRVCLHAHSLAIRHPENCEQLQFRSTIRSWAAVP